MYDSDVLEKYEIGLSQLLYFIVIADLIFMNRILFNVVRNSINQLVIMKYVKKIFFFNDTLT